MEFCNDRGDILVGLNNSIHIIRHQAYLPKVCLLKLVCMRFPEQVKEEELERNEKVLAAMSELQREKVDAAKSSYAK